MVLKVTPVGQASKRFLSVIYGQPGSGKTYSSGTLDGKTLIIDFDRGTSALPPTDKVDVFSPSSYEELISSMFEIENSDYDNIVLDTITAVQNKLKSQYTPPIQIKDWGIMASKLTKLIEKLDFISTSGKNVIILAQEKIIDEDDPQNILSTVDVLPSVRNELTAAARVIGRMYFKDGEHRIALEQHPKRITKASVYGIDVHDIDSFKTLMQRLEEDK